MAPALTSEEVREKVENSDLKRPLCLHAVGGQTLEVIRLTSENAVVHVGGLVCCPWEIVPLGHIPTIYQKMVDDYKAAISCPTTKRFPAWYCREMARQKAEDVFP